MEIIKDDNRCEDKIMYKLKIYFSDGTSEIDDEDYETKDAAIDGYESWLDNWNEGAEVLDEAGEDHSDADIIGYKILKQE